MKGWVGLVGWPVAHGLPTTVVTDQLQVERGTGKVCQPETDVLPLCNNKGISLWNLMPNSKRRKFGKLWFWSPAMPCGDMHQSVTDALVRIFSIVLTFIPPLIQLSSVHYNTGTHFCKYMYGSWTLFGNASTVRCYDTATSAAFQVHPLGLAKFERVPRKCQRSVCALSPRRNFVICWSSVLSTAIHNLWKLLQKPTAPGSEATHLITVCH